MKRTKKVSDDLRPHYDLDRLQIVAVGPGWARRSLRKGDPITRAKERYYALRLAPARRLFSARQIDRDLLTDFFMTFARAEYALKEAGYLEQKQKTVRILWDKFAAQIGDHLLDTEEPAVQRAIKYLFENPPARQIVKDGSLAWEQRQAESRKDFIFLIRSITTVRNNLFHGGKKLDAPIAERDYRLLLSCLNLLSYALTLNKEVFRFFQEVPPEKRVKSRSDLRRTA